MANRRRVSALILCVGLVLILAVSTAFIAHEADHDCCGEECPVCRMIALHVGLLRTLSLLALILFSFHALLRERSFRYRRNNAGLFTTETPVSRKVRLND